MTFTFRLARGICGDRPTLTYQVLGYLTPAQFLATFNATKPTEGLSRTY